LEISLLRLRNSLFGRIISLLIFVGNCPKSGCSTAVSYYDSGLWVAEISKFPVKFPVSREFPWRRVRSPLRRQPTSHSTGGSGRAPVETAAFYRLFARLSQVSSLPKMAILARICRKSLAQTAEIPVFVETIGGDWFDRHWTVGVAVNLRRFGPLMAVEPARTVAIERGRQLRRPYSPI
jgi:hypothetical protein